MKIPPGVVSLADLLRSRSSVTRSLQPGNQKKEKYMVDTIGKFTKVVNFATEQVRTLSVNASGAYTVALPRAFVRALGWEGKKVKVKLVMDRNHKWKSIAITVLDGEEA